MLNSATILDGQHAHRFFAETVQQPSGNGFVRTIYVNAQDGNDANDGLTPATAVRTIKRAYELRIVPCAK